MSLPLEAISYHNLNGTVDVSPSVHLRWHQCTYIIGVTVCQCEITGLKSGALEYTSNISVTSLISHHLARAVTDGPHSQMRDAAFRAF